MRRSASLELPTRSISTAACEGEHRKLVVASKNDRRPPAAGEGRQAGVARPTRVGVHLRARFCAPIALSRVLRSLCVSGCAGNPWRNPQRNRCQWCVCVSVCTCACARVWSSRCWRAAGCQGVHWWMVAPAREHSRGCPGSQKITSFQARSISRRRVCVRRQSVAGPFSSHGCCMSEVTPGLLECVVHLSPPAKSHCSPLQSVWVSVWCLFVATRVARPSLVAFQCPPPPPFAGQASPAIFLRPSCAQESFDKLQSLSDALESRLSRLYDKVESALLGESCAAGTMDRLSLCDCGAATSAMPVIMARADTFLSCMACRYWGFEESDRSSAIRSVSCTAR